MESQVPHWTGEGFLGEDLESLKGGPWAGGVNRGEVQRCPYGVRVHRTGTPNDMFGVGPSPGVVHYEGSVGRSSSSSSECRDTASTLSFWGSTVSKGN